MRRLLLIALLIFAGPGIVSAAAPEDLYINIFNLIVKGDELQEKGQGRAALEKFLEADRDLKNLKAAYGTWSKKIVDFRLKYLAKQIGPLKVQYPGTVIPQPGVVGGMGNAKWKTGKGGKGGKGGSVGVNTALRELNEELIQTSRAKTVLEQKLREALAARPADMDPGAYAKAQERIRTLEKSDDVNQVTLDRSSSELNRLRSEYEALHKKYATSAARGQETKLREDNTNMRRQILEFETALRGASNADELKRKVSLLQTDLKAAEQRANALANQNQTMHTSMQSADTTKLQADNVNLRNQVQQLSQLAGKVGDLDGMTLKLRQMETELQVQRSTASQLARDKQRLESAAANVPVLTAENTALKSEVSKLNEIASSVPRIQVLQNELAAAKAKVQTEQSLRASLAREKQKLEDLLTDPDTQLGGNSDELKSLQKENAALHTELKNLNNDVQKNSAQSSRVKALELERSRLQKELEQALKNRDAQKKTAVTPPAEDSGLKKKLALAEARIASLESSPEPFDPQELALLKKPAAPKPAPASVQQKREFPASAAQMALQAQRAYEARRYDEAESKYKEILTLEQSNVYTLANLAAAQMELNKLSEAEANLSKALSIHGDDAFSLSLFGLVKFRQGDFDAALDMLSRSAVLNPDNAQTQNYLGLALSHKGLRIAAEAAFRKAVKLAPGYSVAHYNLAVFYATANTPSPELAKWHYQKARAAGHPKSDELENMLASR